MTAARTLDALAKDEIAVIAHVDGDPLVVRRLMEMGLVGGTEVRMVRAAPFGDRPEPHGHPCVALGPARGAGRPRQAARLVGGR